MIEVDKRICRPKFLPQLVACDYFPRPLQQHQQHRERLLLHTQANTRLAQLPGLRIGLIDAEAENSIGMGWRHRNHLNPVSFL